MDTKRSPWQEEKFRSINLDNNAYKNRVATCIGGTSLLRAVGFAKEESRLFMSMEVSHEASICVRTAIRSLRFSLSPFVHCTLRAVHTSPRRVQYPLIQAKCERKVVIHSILLISCSFPPLTLISCTVFRSLRFDFLSLFVSRWYSCLQARDEALLTASKEKLEAAIASYVPTKAS